MRPLEGLSEYLGALERRLRILAFTRGAALTALAALTLTVLAVLVINQFAFSDRSVIGARVFLFLGLAFALAAALVVPLIRLNRRRAARRAEQSMPEFEERLLTFTEKYEQNAGDPFLPLLAADTMEVARRAEPSRIVQSRWILSFSSAACFSVAALIWLGISGPGFMGYGTHLLWAGLPKGESKPFYDVKVEPGNRTVRKRADQLVTAQLFGFTSNKVRIFARYASSSAWEQAEMAGQPGGSAHQFVFAGIPESLDYYVEAGGIRSGTYHLNVVDLPSVSRIRVTYHYPGWTGMKDQVEDPGGDLRAVGGTVADVAIKTDRPLNSGALVLDDGSKLPLRSGPEGTLIANVPIQKDGMYHVAAVEGGEDVRLTEDYFIEAQKDREPEVRISRPGRDMRVSPIEEVAVTVEAKDDFGLKNVELHYSVNGGVEKTMPVLQGAGARDSTGRATIAMEDFKAQPGDVVSLYAVAKDARSATRTDMFFIQAEPFERNYSQSQQAGGGGGMDGQGDGNEQQQISQRQKEIITATFNQIKAGAKADAENAAFLSQMQAKLRDQAKSLATRMRARQIQEAGDSFKAFAEAMDKAVEAMGPASDRLKSSKWQDALAPEQQALQQLLRAESTFRDIQVAFGNRQQGGRGGGGGNSATRDLQGLFDLELDTEKNQYETSRGGQSQSADARQREIDEAMQKLEQLARRQQELAEQQRRNQVQTSQQRYQQEMLRREAEQLQQQMRDLSRSDSGQLSRNQQGQQQSGQQGQQSGQQGQQSGQQGQQSGQQAQSGAQGQSGQQQRGQQGMQGNQQGRMAGNRQGQQQLEQAINRLEEALRDMRGAASSQQTGTPESQAQARRAADRLREAQQTLSGMRREQSSGQVGDLVRQAEDLANRQQEIDRQLRQAYTSDNSRGMTREQAQSLADRKEAEAADLKRLESGMQAASRDLMSTQRQAASRMRETLGDLQQAELGRSMQRNADYIRRGLGSYAVISEFGMTQALNALRDQLREVEQAMAPGADGKPGEDSQAMAQALENVERLRQQMQQMAAGRNQGRNQGQRGQQQGQQGQQSQQSGQQGQQNGQQGQQGGQQGQQNGQQGQQGGQQGQQGGQRGQQGQMGQQGGQRQGGQPGGQWQPGQAGNAWGGGPGGADFNGGWPVSPREFESTYRDTLSQLRGLQPQVRDDAEFARDLQGLIRDLQRLDPSAYSNDPLLAERINSAVLGGIEQVELQLRRKVDEAQGGSVRSQGSGSVPPGYADKVADYFRRLSKSR